MNLAAKVLAKLGKANEAPTSNGGGGRFRHAAELALKAAKSDDIDGFEKALDAAVRIKLAERGTSE